MLESLLASLGSGGVGAAWTLAATGFVVAVATTVGLGRQRAILVRLDERMAHLTAAVSLLTNTTEEGWRSVAAEMGRLGHASPPAPAPAAVPAPQRTLRERIASAAGHGRSVQDIAVSEQVSEGEVLLHLLLDRLQTDGSPADVC